MTTHEYNPVALYAELAESLFAARRKAQAVGGSNNIREKGDGPERALRGLLQSIIGTSYRVTHGHVVKANGQKSKQIDVIILKDSPSATMMRADPDGAELVRVEWVAAVGEVKAGWTKHYEVLDSYQQLEREIAELQQGIRGENAARFGEDRDETPLGALTRPITGRRWENNCYVFMVVLDTGQHDARQIGKAFKSREICPEDKAIMVLDENSGGLLLVPGWRDEHEGRVTVHIGVDADVKSLDSQHDQDRGWYAIEVPGSTGQQKAGRILGRFLTEIQLHLSSWYETHGNATHYARLQGATALMVDRL